MSTKNLEKLFYPKKLEQLFYPKKSRKVVLPKIYRKIVLPVPGTIIGSEGGNIGYPTITGYPCILKKKSWIDEWINEWMDGWMYELIYGWMEK